MASTMEEIKKGAGDEIIEALADKGYQQPEDMIECLEKGIIPNVILPDGQETYELEIEYEEKGCDKSSKSTEEIKKCLHNGIVPDVYEEVIEKIEVVETKKKVVDEPAEMAEPYATEEEMRSVQGKDFMYGIRSVIKYIVQEERYFGIKVLRKTETRDTRIKQHVGNVHIEINV